MKLKNFLLLSLFFLFVSSETLAQVTLRSGPARMKHTVRTRNIYGVRDNSLSNPKLYGDYDGLAQNHFGNIFGGAFKDSPNPSFIERQRLIQECKSAGRFGGGPRYAKSFGYENGFSSCEYLEYREYLAGQRYRNHK